MQTILPPTLRHTCPNGTTRNNVNIRTDNPFWNQRVRARDPKHNHSALSLVISGRYGMFADISSQPSSPVSYPAPTYGALSNILRHLAPNLGTTFVPLGIEFLAPVAYTKMAFKLSGPERKSVHHKNGNDSMFHHIILKNPKFRIFFLIKAFNKDMAAATLIKIQRSVKNSNHRPLFMGNREYEADVTFNDPSLPICESVNFVLPSMLKKIAHDTGKIEVYHNVICENGVVVYPTPFQTVSAN